MPTLSQRLGSFPSESRAESFLHCRQDCPLPPPINRDGFYSLREEKIGAKVSQKTSHFPLFLQFSLFLSLSLHRGLQPPPPSSPVFPPSNTPQEANTTTSLSQRFYHQPATKKPLWLSSPSPSRVSLSSANFFFLRSSNSGGQALHQRRHQPLHQHDHRPSPPQVVLHPCLASTAPVAHCCCRCMQNSFCMQRPK